MPRVPRQALAPTQAPQFSAPQTQPVSDATGTQLAQFGQGLAKFGGSLSRVQDVLQDDIDAAKAKEGDNLAADVFRVAMDDPASGYLNKRGKNALEGSREQAFTGIEDKIKEIEDGLTTEQQRSIFRENVNVRMGHAKMRADDHESRQVIVFEMGQAEAGVKSHMADAITLVGTPGHDLNKALMLRDVDTASELAGWSDEQRENARLGATTEMHALILDRMMRQDPKTASAYYGKNSKEIDPRARPKIEEELARQQRVSKQSQMDAIALNYAMELSNGEWSTTEQLEAINQSVRTGKIDGDTAVKTWSLVNNIADQKAQETQRARSTMSQELEQAFAKNPSLTMDTIPAETMDAIDRLGMRGDAVRIRRTVHENRIADMLANGDIEYARMDKDVTTMEGVRRMITFLENRRPEGDAAKTKDGIKKNEHIDAQIKFFEDFLEGIILRPRVFVMNDDLPTATSPKQQQQQRPPFDMKQFAEQMQKAMYPQSERR